MKKIQQSKALLLIGIFVLFCLVPAIPAGQKININSAPKAQLVTLKHVGEKLADRIIKYRKKKSFKSVKDLLNVKGIGPKILKANKGKITI